LDLEPRLNLVSVLEVLHPIPEIERIRLSSIEPTDVKPELIEAMKRLRKVCPQLHVPLQSGDCEILKRMNRRYDGPFYRDLVETLRREIPDFCLSMDVIAGFPGEDEPHFQNTLSLIDETRPIRVHAFPYSRRPGTRAASFDDLPPTLLRERMNRLLAFSGGVVRREKEKFIGARFSVLVETDRSSDGLLEGHTPHYLKVLFPGSRDEVGKSVPVRLVGLEENHLVGVREDRLE